MAAAPPAKAEQTIKATPAEKQAAERLGSVFQYIAARKGLPLGVWAVPLERKGTTHAALLAALYAIYGSDTERRRALEKLGKEYLNAYDFYKKDYESVIPKVGRATLRWSQSALTKEETALGTLRLKIQSQPGLAERLHTTAERIGRAIGGFAATSQEFRDAAPRRESKVPGVPASQVDFGSPKHLLTVNKLVRARVAKGLREERNRDKDRKDDAIETLSTLFAHPQGVTILRTYSDNAADGTGLAASLVQKAQDATVAFRVELTDPTQDTHFWRYPALVSQGLKELGLYDVPGFGQYALSIGQVLSKGAVEQWVNFASVAIACLGLVFTGPVALVVLAAGDLALAGAGAGMSYVREREQELGAEASAWRGESDQLAASPDYLDTALAGAAALLSAIALFRSAKELRELLAARPKSIPEVIAPKVEPASPRPEPPDPRTLDRSFKPNEAAATAAEKRGVQNSVKAADDEQKAMHRGLTRSSPEEAAAKPPVATVKPGLADQLSDVEKQIDRLRGHPDAPALQRDLDYIRMWEGRGRAEEAQELLKNLRKRVETANLSRERGVFNPALESAEVDPEARVFGPARDRPPGVPKSDSQVYARIRRGEEVNITGFTNPPGARMNIDPNFRPFADHGPNYTPPVVSEARMRSLRREFDFPPGPTNRQLAANGESPYLRSGDRVELHHRDQDPFAALDESSEPFHQYVRSDPEFHPEITDPGYESWRRHYAFFEGRRRTLGDIYGILRDRYWRARFQ
jgi:hypothetical protein